MQISLKYPAVSASTLKPSYILSFVCGAAIVLGFSTLRGSNTESPQHVYELRLYHVNAGKMDALKARFRDHVDAIFRRHNMKSIGYWSPEDVPGISGPTHLYSGASQPAGNGEELGCFPSRSGMAEGKGGIGGEWKTGRSHRPLLYGSDQLFSAQIASFAADRDSAPSSRVSSVTLLRSRGWHFDRLRAERSSRDLVVELARSDASTGGGWMQVCATD